MFGMGWPEIGLILVVALLLFGPEKLPELAKQAGGFVRTVRRMADNAKNDLGREMGEDFSGINLRDLDPREIVRRNFLDEDDTTPAATKETRILRPGEKPPFDSEAT
ncbi:sec-independent protein translocase protein TatB [Aeromicrobium fastidiosum]|uniref:Twin-arginine translocase subunit TatB n=2 Tax=Aeromicrobium fastidiosum TaxID=52699 RepID=A0A641AJR3_9ACTN|nr:twin-arginine translocase subunit TatB [Aeromicrobium fastidiosum]MBP2390966.1 sec-independent protein translocase protein TatB [Aeromicrobium fastidiosum]